MFMYCDLLIFRASYVFGSWELRMSIFPMCTCRCTLLPSLVLDYLVSNICPDENLETKSLALLLNACIAPVCAQPSFLLLTPTERHFRELDSAVTWLCYKADFILYALVILSAHTSIGIEIPLKYWLKYRPETNSVDIITFSTVHVIQVLVLCKYMKKHIT